MSDTKKAEPWSDAKNSVMAFAERVRDLTREFEFPNTEPDPSVALPFVVEKHASELLRRLTLPTDAERALVEADVRGFVASSRAIRAHASGDAEAIKKWDTEVSTARDDRERALKTIAGERGGLS